MLINVGEEFGRSLETSEIAVELIDILNKIDGDDFILDFKDVLFITMNFAQAYYNAKYDSPKRYPKSILGMRLALLWVLLMRHATLNLFFCRFIFNLIIETNYKQHF